MAKETKCRSSKKAYQGAEWFAKSFKSLEIKKAQPGLFANASLLASRLAVALLFFTVKKKADHDINQ